MIWLAYLAAFGPVAALLAFLCWLSADEQGRGWWFPLAFIGVFALATCLIVAFLWGCQTLSAFKATPTPPPAPAAQVPQQLEQPAR